jgi:UDP-N-acetylmuramoyl-L-alanine---L-glutamate ligase
MKLAEFEGQHVAIWGAGVEGAAATSLLQRRVPSAALLVVVDHARPTDPSFVHGVRVVDLSKEAIPTTVTCILKSPGISPHHGGLAEFRRQRPQVPITGGSALWFAEAAAAETRPLDRTIAVTGSKGKSTTSSLIAHLLRALTDDVVLAGNVGRAPLDVLDLGLANGAPFPANRWHVLELSSFQASEIHHGPRIGVLTSLFPEHLDWHLTVDCYYDDKINLFRHGVGQPTVVAANMGNADVAQQLSQASFSIASFGAGDGFVVAPDGSISDPLHGEFISRASIPLVGAHNAFNVCGALTALRLAGWNPWDHREVLIGALATFQPLEHRLQPVGFVGGRLAIDDSLSTAPQAAIAALGAYNDRPVGIVIGGHDRGLDYEALAVALAARTTATWVVGVPQSGPRIGALIEAACSDAGNTSVVVQQVDDFDDAVPVLLRNVPEGGVLLLSPAAPSFGRFRDYKERGLRFRELLGLA